MENMKFNEFKLSSEILKSVEMLKYTNPTNVQKQVIPAFLDKRDVIVKSQTGSGKTAAFAIPACEMVNWDENKPQVIVLTPTRELAIQVKEDIFNIGRYKRIKVSAVYGRAPIRYQIKELKQKTHVVVGTPGRLFDHIERGTLDTSEVKYLVIDEADEMLNMGFIDQIRVIINKLPKERVTTLLSATMPRDIENLCSKYMKDPLFVEIEDQSPTAERIVQERFDVEYHNKMKLLKDISIVENPDSCIVFCNTKQKVDEVQRELENLKYRCDKIHGGMEQDDRIDVMDDFRAGYFRYLIATDVAARGIDIENISLVINFDIPQDPENYVHRIGRTGRKGNLGKALTFVTQRESKFLNQIEKYTENPLISREMPSSELVESLREEFNYKMDEEPEIKMTKGDALSEDIMKIHINAGKKTKMRPVDIVGTLCNVKGMTAQDIGIINVLDISTYVEILNGKGQKTLKELQTTPIKGRLRRVSIAD